MGCWGEIQLLAVQCERTEAALGSWSGIGNKPESQESALEEQTNTPGWDCGAGGSAPLDPTLGSRTLTWEIPG